MKKQSARQQPSSNPTELRPGDIEYELGIAIPGTILPAEQWARTAIKKLPEGQTLDFAAIFARQAPIALEIGCGNGRFTISSAVLRPDWNHLAIDILPAVLRYATRRANQRGLTNVRVAACDGWRCLSELVAASSINEIHIYHPQPYADPNDSGKRMLTAEFIRLIYQALVPGGKLFVQTDRVAYWDYIQTVMPEFFQWFDQSTAWEEQPLVRSRREILSQAQGLKIYRGVGIVGSCEMETHSATGSLVVQQYSPEQLDELVKRLPRPQFEIQSSPKRPIRGKYRRSRRR
jgi:tRNA (guanine-N7-)-methyltransferase